MDIDALRKKILDLAIQGKLVPQDPNDEPASVLLERIRAQKEQMVKEGKLRPRDIKDDTIIFKGEDNLHYEKLANGSLKCCDLETDYEIPSNWAWCNLGFLFNHNTGKALNSSNSEGNVLTYITTSNVYWNRFELDNLKSMPFSDTEIEKCTARKGDLLVCEGGDIGRAAIWNSDDEIRIQNHLHRLRPYGNVYTLFYYYVLYLYKLEGKINGNGIGLQGLSSNALHNIIVPVPPVNEQKNIVVSIKNLMSTIDNIEGCKDTLVSYVHNAKAKILDLAFCGKLVAQNPSDESAFALLERIQTEKKELAKQGKIRREKKRSIIFKGEDNSYYEQIGSVIKCIDNKIPFEIPENWRWARLSSIAEITMGSSPKSHEICSDDNFMEFHQGKIYFSNKMLQASNQYSKNITKKAPKFSVLLCVRAPVGEVNITDREICIGRGLASIKPLCNISEEFIFYWLQPCKQYFLSQSTGSTFSAITSDIVRDLLVPIPPQPEQHRILVRIREYFDLLDQIGIIE